MTPAERLAEAVALEHGFTLRSLRDKDRRPTVVAARWAAIAALRSIRRPDGAPRYSTTFIGRVMARDHCTVLYALSAVERRRLGA